MVVDPVWTLRRLSISTHNTKKQNSSTLSMHLLDTVAIILRSEREKKRSEKRVKDAVHSFVVVVVCVCVYDGFLAHIIQESQSQGH